MADKYIDQSGDRKYFTQIPNCIDDMNLSPYAYRLYGHIKRVAGEDGACWQSQATLSEKCNMSTATISRAKRELEEEGLITIVLTRGVHGGKDFHTITISDIWLRNITSYSPQSSDSTLQDTTSTLQSTVVRLKKNPINKNPLIITNKEEEEERVEKIITFQPESSPTTTNIFSLYESEIGIITPKIADDLKDIEKTYPVDWIKSAFHEAAINNKRSLAYSMAILKRWKIEGFGTKTNGKNSNDSAREAARQQMMREEAETRRYIEEVRIGTAI